VEKKEKNLEAATPAMPDFSPRAQNNWLPSDVGGENKIILTIYKISWNGEDELVVMEKK